MTPRAAFSIHGDIIRYRGEDVARLTYPLTGITDLFLAALGCARNVDTDTLEQDITDLSAEVDYLRLEAAKALKFLAIADLRAVYTLLTRIVDDAP